MTERGPGIARLPLASAALLAILSGPSAGWEARAGAICELTHETPRLDIYLSYDPRLPLYTITLTRRDAPWRPGPVSAIEFDGPRGLTISTPRHVLKDANTALTVTDSGFGNVLDGLQFNTTATARLGDQAVTVALDGAAPAVAAFRACTAGANA